MTVPYKYNWDASVTWRDHARTKIVFARNLHRCDLCRSTISAGEEHAVVPPGRIAHRAHLACVWPGRKPGMSPNLKTHCVNGHELTEENTDQRLTQRRCRICHRDQERNRQRSKRKTGWLEPGDMVQTGDFKVLKTGEWTEVKGLGFQHKAHHAPVWRPATKTPTLDERKAMLAISTERQERRFGQADRGGNCDYEARAREEESRRRARDNRDQVEEDRRWSEANGFPDVGG